MLLLFIEQNQTARSKWAVKECARLNVTRDLFRTGQIVFGGGPPVSGRGAPLERYELVPHVSSSEIENARWYLAPPTSNQ
jgi:hypothetical protein